MPLLTISSTVPYTCYTIPQPNSMHAQDPFPMPPSLCPPLPTPLAKTAEQMASQAQNVVPYPPLVHFPIYPQLLKS